MRSVPICRRSCFNPLPARRPGETRADVRRAAVAAVFQSAPGTKAGRDDSASSLASISTAVSIRSRHEGRERHPHSLPRCHRPAVSIRSRHEGRERRVSEKHLTPVTMFQSAPGTKAGRDNPMGGARFHPRSFNPLPARRPGETFSPGLCRVGFGRFNPLPARRPGETSVGNQVKFHYNSFNPLPARRPGETCAPQPCDRRCCCFNPLPARRPRETSLSSTSRAFRASFNPLPARRPGETFMAASHQIQPHVSIRSRHEGRERPALRRALPARRYVSIRSRHEGRERPRTHRGRRAENDVSIRSRHEGRERPDQAHCCLPKRLFQSAPGTKAGRDPEWLLSLPRLSWFQSAPGTKAGRDVRSTAL